MSMTGVNLVACTSILIRLWPEDIFADSMERTGMSKRESKVASTSCRSRSGVRWTSPSSKMERMNFTSFWQAQKSRIFSDSCALSMLAMSKARSNEESAKCTQP